MRGDEARKVCPEMQLVQVPTSHGKADLTIYRNSGLKVSAFQALDSQKILLAHEAQLGRSPAHAPSGEIKHFRT